MASAGRIRARYVDRTPASGAIATRAGRVMPAGETRAAAYHRPYPLTFERGAAARLYDVDGHTYWDLAGNYTALVHGHAYGPIVEAATAAVRNGTAWPGGNVHQVDLAERLVARIGSVEQVRFTNSGTEAAMLALAVARVVTGRPKILMARFGYHGSHEAFEVGAFGGRFATAGPEVTLLADYGNVSSFARILAEQGDEIAAVFLEPVMGSAGIVAAPPGFLAAVHDAAGAAGALFVLDEIITLRLALGGAQSLAGVVPDLTLLGKLIGGGFPVGAVGGRAELMATIDPRAGRLFHSGTFNGNPVTMATGTASVDALTGSRIDEMGRLAARLDVGLTAAAAVNGLPCSIRRAGSLLNVYFTATLPDANVTRADDRAIRAFHLASINHGLHFAPRGLLVVSTVMDDAAIDDIVERAAAAMADVADDLGDERAGGPDDAVAS